MHVDLLTLYLLIIGTLLASSGMTLWEHRSHPRRSVELRVLAAGYATLAIGCAAAVFRRDVPGPWGSALSNLVILSGYLLVLHGVALLSGRQYRAASVGLLFVMALTWMVGGARSESTIWAYVSAIPIALASGMTSRELLRGDDFKALPSRYIAVAVTGIHALTYATRALALPWLAARYGNGLLLTASAITMYEGVLYSVVLPMTLLKLVREETHGQLLQESQTDYLTGLGNRRWFFEQGERVVGEGGKNRPLSLLALDLDHFKKLNDRYGHKTGDEVLKSFAQIARGVVGREAVLARIGGEEFAALLPCHDEARAKAVGEEIVTRFAQTVSHRVDGMEILATVSIGLTHSADAGQSLAELLAAADEALYRAKSLGGNRLEGAQKAASLKVVR
ncbi:GGDEF domain-containing protein [Burkholderia sp. WSM2230]|uniref:GGDEF domain-containing protein n=1 Tax=Burkholderia sp. WSM2230 TaxID=944435 RepID=UPI0004727F5B|nr:sensor domain-containing diguanylate cyclase [Burkholderia sp. WSM2230]